MKKILAIAMLFAFLFNLGGYSLFFQYMIDRSDNKIIDRINNNYYRSSDLVEVKIPVNLPTLQDWTDYKAISGQIQTKDQKYNYAEIKMTRDTLYLLVIPNHDRTKLVNANIGYANHVNDIPLNKKSNNLLVKKSFGDSKYHSIAINFKPAMLVSDAGRYDDHSFLNIITYSPGVPGQPPEMPVILS